MARKVRDASLDSRAARSRLEARGKPYYRAIDPGLHLGYRKLRGGPGKWVVRLYAGGQTYVVETIATADDLSDATFKDREIPKAKIKPTDILSFGQAQERARAIRDERSRSAAGVFGPYTIDNAIDDYLLFLETNRRTADDARYRYKAFIEKPLGKIEVAALTAKKIRDWHADLAKLPPRLRTKKGNEQKHAELGKDDEARRRRKSSANRTLTVLKAALNMAWREGNVISDAEWRRVKPFGNVDAARVRYITVPEAKRLLNVCEPDFRKMVQAALETGARYSHIARLVVSDFNPDAGTVTIRTSSDNKRGTHVVLTDQGRAFFRQVCLGRSRGDLMFTKANGLPWEKSEQDRRIKEASELAKIKPVISFNILRHTWASLAVMAGVPLMVVAKNMGHRDTRMVEKHYGHLAPSFIADAIRDGAPRFGFKPDKKVAALRAS
jgi:integrase